MLLPEPTSVAAASPEGVPSSRMVLPEPVSADGFVFHTKCGSRKMSRSGRTGSSLESLRHAKGVFFLLEPGVLAAHGTARRRRLRRGRSRKTVLRVTLCLIDYCSCPSSSS